MPYLLGQKSGKPHDRLFWRAGGGPRYAAREGRYKLVKNDEGKPQLYDLETDIGETKDLAAAQPALYDRLQSAYAAWNREMIAPVFPGPPPRKQKG
ncbi:MAG: hypothetical protein ABIZ80_01325 [Bryobacteraceae bacterium]